MELILTGEFGRMVATRAPNIISVPLEAVVGLTRLVPTDLDLVRTARALGISFGDAGHERNAEVGNG